MSEVLRIALVAEGYTDKVVLSAAIGAMLGDRPFVLRLLQPVESLPLESAEPYTGMGKGWGGVYLWCREAVRRSGSRLRDDALLFLEYDLLILHLDADVAGKHYSDYEIEDAADDLPCEEACPPPSATTDRLRTVLLRWVGEVEIPPRTVLCTPSKSCEAWVVAALFPDDKEMEKSGWECHPNPEKRLSVQPKDQRLRKTEREYNSAEDRLAEEWPRVSKQLSEAARFASEFSNQLEAMG
ncbi:MAG: hypothetical protein ACR2OZ_02525 [Verrucomicrobiales bacterium]